MHVNSRTRSLIIAVCAFGTIAATAHAEYQSERPMYVQKYEALNLEVWTEVEPLWNSTIRYHGSKPLLLITTPHNVYPPMSMSVISFPGMSFTAQEFDQAFNTFLESALQNYQLDKALLQSLPVRETEYGDLKGREIEFQAMAHGRLSDIKVFLGFAEGKGPVLLQVITLKGKMPHLQGSLTRSWGNIRYLQ